MEEELSLSDKGGYLTDGRRTPKGVLPFDLAYAFWNPGVFCAVTNYSKVPCIRLKIQSKHSTSSS